MFRKFESIYKASRTHKSRYTPAKIRLKKTINMTSVSSHIDLNNRVSVFLPNAFVMFLQEDKVRKGEKIEMPAKRRHNFLMRGIIKIHRHGFVGERSSNLLSEFQPICSRGCRLGTRNINARTTRLFFTFQENKIRHLTSVK